MKPTLALCLVLAGCAVSDDVTDDRDVDVATDEAAILGGGAPAPGGHTWMMQVHAIGHDPCQAVLISPRHVLTMADCIAPSPQAWVRYRTWSGVVWKDGLQSVSESANAIHYGADGDYAVLTLYDAIEPNTGLVPIDLPITRPTPGQGVRLASLTPATGQVDYAQATIFAAYDELTLQSSSQLCATDAGAGVVSTVNGVDYLVGMVSGPSSGGGACGVPGAGFHAMNIIEVIDGIVDLMRSPALPYDGDFHRDVVPYADGYDFGLPSPYETVVGDFDGNGLADYGRIGGTYGYFYFSFQVGGTFYSLPRLLAFTGLDFGMPSTWTTRVGDFNGDGVDDLVRLGGTGPWLFWGTGAMTFTRSFIAYSGLDFGQPTTWDTAIGDFNGDGYDDYARIGGTGAWVFYGKSNKTFTQTFHAYPGLNFGQPALWQLAVGDFNGDHRTDYARIGNTGGWVFYGQSNKTFTVSFHGYGPGTDFGWPSPYELLVGDWNGDGRTDYRRLGPDASYTFLAGSGGFAMTSQWLGGLDFGMPSAWKTLVGDWNGDHRDDFVRLGDLEGYLFHGAGPATVTINYWDFRRHYGLPSPFESIAGDFNGDGKDDVVRLGGVHAVFELRN